MHKVIFIHWGFDSSSELYGTGIVDEDVEAAKFGYGLLNCMLHLFLRPDIDNARQTRTTSRFDCNKLVTVKPIDASCMYIQITVPLTNKHPFTDGINKDGRIDRQV